jgi:hypothetical protein
MAMERQFWAYYLPLPKQIEELWASAFFTFDTSVLLDLYQYSPEAHGEFFGILNGIPERIWLSNQAALEYHRGRVGVISDQQKRVGDVIQALNRVKAQIRTAIQGGAGMEDLNEALSETETVLKRFREQQSAVGMHEPHAGVDKIQLSLNQYFSDERSLGAPYSEEQLRAIYDEGRTRFQEQVPPGFRDAETKPEPARYGDLVLWKQVLDEAAARNAPTLLVINDSKDDWWRLNGNTPFAPRAELREEIRRVANVDCWFYRLDQFLKLAKQHLEAEVSDETIKEVQTVEERDAVKGAKSFDDWLRTQYPELAPRLFIGDLSRLPWDVTPRPTLSFAQLLRDTFSQNIDVSLPSVDGESLYGPVPPPPIGDSDGEDEEVATSHDPDG